MCIYTTFSFTGTFPSFCLPIPEELQTLLIRVDLISRLPPSTLPSYLTSSEFTVSSPFQRAANLSDPVVAPSSPVLTSGLSWSLSLTLPSLPSPSHAYQVGVRSGVSMGSGLTSGQGRGPQCLPLSVSFKVLLKLQRLFASVLLHMFIPIQNFLPMPYLLSHTKFVQVSNCSSFLKTQLSPFLESPSLEPLLLANRPMWVFSLVCKLTVLSFICSQVCSPGTGILESPAFILYILCL